MRLYKLIGLEIEALMKEHDETLENIDQNIEGYFRASFFHGKSNHQRTDRV